ncbi:MAG: TadE/TadG family type IV pilus assembly protein [Armatimonadota bacterium]|nr:TadE/TadG family type IV pilus assembly protein [Armatimonadota bacterium]
MNMLSRRKVLRSCLAYKRKGQSVVEFAFGAILLAILFAGIAAFGQFFGWLHTLNNAAREGARLGAMCKSDGEIIARINQMTMNLPNRNSLQIAITPPGRRIHGQTITVTLVYDAPVLPIPFVLQSPRRVTVRSSFLVHCGTDTMGITSGQTCSASTCSGSTCLSPTCSGPTCSGSTCSGPTCRVRTCGANCD